MYNFKLKMIDIKIYIIIGTCIIFLPYSVKPWNFFGLLKIITNLLQKGFLCSE